jgi:hypothetical protein
MADSRDGTVFVSEDIDIDDIHVLTGLFSAHLEGPGDEFLEGPEGVTAGEAIAWGRAHADVVLIRLGDSDVHCSAGARRPEPAEDCDFPVWPEGKVVERRRFPGMEHLDLVTTEPIDWEVRLPRRVSRRRADEDAAALHAALAADEAISDVRVEIERSKVRLGKKRADAILTFVVRARSHREAMDTVLEVERRTFDRFPYPVDELPRRRRRQGIYIDEKDWDPSDDIRPR